MQFHKLRLRQIVDETEQAYTLTFDRPAGSMWDFRAGQYLTIQLYIEGEAHRRPYSLSSSPLEEEFLSVTIKRLSEGLVSNYLRDHLKPGDEVEVFPPLGNFLVEPTPLRIRHYILIGGGSGITPLISILKTVLAIEPDSKVTLWYGNRKEEDIIFKEALLGLKKKYRERFTLIHVLSQAPEDWKGPRGRLDRDKIYEYILELFMVDEYQKAYYLCGPEGLMIAAQEAMDIHAIDPRHVFQEHFVGNVLSLEEQAQALESEEELPEMEDKTYSISITLDDEEYEVTVPPGKSILDAALDAGLDAPYSCKGGVCTTCMGRVKKGEVEHSDSIILLESERKKGVVLTCQARPTSDEVEISFGY
ncbi:MAG: ferredoxin--NADP reductase [Bacteroidota bacterium]